LHDEESNRQDNLSDPEHKIATRILKDNFACLVMASKRQIISSSHYIPCDLKHKAAAFDA
jgi:hypothetical protein